MGGKMREWRRRKERNVSGRDRRDVTEKME